MIIGRVELNLSGSKCIKITNEFRPNPTQIDSDQNGLGSNELGNGS